MSDGLILVAAIVFGVLAVAFSGMLGIRIGVNAAERRQKRPCEKPCKRCDCDASEMARMLMDQHAAMGSMLADMTRRVMVLATPGGDGASWAATEQETDLGMAAVRAGAVKDVDVSPGRLGGNGGGHVSRGFDPDDPDGFDETLSED